MQVFVGIGQDAPLPEAAVSAELSPAALGTLQESVDTFIRRLSGEEDDVKAAWVAPVLDATTATGTTDKSGIAFLRLKIVGAVSGRYALTFTASGMSSSKVGVGASCCTAAGYRDHDRRVLCALLLLRRQGCSPSRTASRPCPSRAPSRTSWW